MRTNYRGTKEKIVNALGDRFPRMPCQVLQRLSPRLFRRLQTQYDPELLNLEHLKQCPSKHGLVITPMAIREDDDDLGENGRCDCG
jgi:hypothetical protein